MNPFTSADAGAIQQVLFSQQRSICVCFHEFFLLPRAQRPGELADDKEVRLDYVLSIFTHSTVNNSDN